MIFLSAALQVVLLCLKFRIVIFLFKIKDWLNFLIFINFFLKELYYFYFILLKIFILFLIQFF